MRHVATVIGILLGLLFVVLGVMYFGKMMKMPPPPEGSLPALFMGAMFPSGYLDFVKVLEMIGGILVAIPLTRNIGLLILGPIIVNIVAYQIFLNKGQSLMDPILIFIVVAPLILLAYEAKAFSGLIRREA